ncbi:hypothetical protein ACWCPI_28900 [Streptomyces sp. NPDC001920]
MVTAEAAHQHHTEVVGLKSIGVYCVDIAEVQEVGLNAVDDSQVDDGAERPPGHAFVDFKAAPSAKQQKRRASALRDKAEKRGWQHGPTS